MPEHQGKSQFPFADRVEAALIAKYLTGYSVERGVRHIVDDVLHTAQDEQGWISPFQ